MKEEELTEEEWKIKLESYVRQGKLINTNQKNFPLVRKWLYQLACKFHDQKQGVYESIATAELIRLEKKFG